MTRPIIGITATSAEWEGRRRSGIDAAYAESVERAGGEPVLLVPRGSEAPRVDIVALLDGLLLSGGEDIDPSLYRDDRSEHTSPPNVERDRFELALLREALGRPLPVLAICRGAQLLNVALGGSLWQHLATDRADGGEHDHWRARDAIVHDIVLREGSRLADAVQALRTSVNSIHHQGVRALAECLVPTAWSDDGLVEGYEHRTLPWVVGVQWHPEELPSMQPGAAPVAAFVSAAHARVNARQDSSLARRLERARAS